MTRPWLALERFPSRAYLDGVARGMAPTSPQPEPVGRLEYELQSRWAGALGIPADALLLVADLDAAANLLCGAALAPGDVAVLARPTAPRWPAAVLARGARFLDLGRLDDLALDPAAAARAGSLHPGALWLLDDPHLGGGADTLPPEAQARVVVIDRSQSDPADATVMVPAEHVVEVHALRESGVVAAPICVGLVAAPASVPALRALRGPSPLELTRIERGLAALAATASEATSGSDAPWRARRAERRAARLRQVAVEAADWPGATLLAPTLGRVCLRCDRDDAEALADRLRGLGIPAYGLPAHPMRALCVVDLWTPTSVD